METSNNELCIVSTKIRHTQHAHTCFNSALSSALHTADMIKTLKKNVYMLSLCATLNIIHLYTPSTYFC